jgi:hypothetical protein
MKVFFIIINKLEVDVLYIYEIDLVNKKRLFVRYLEMFKK